MSRKFWLVIIVLVGVMAGRGLAVQAQGDDRCRDVVQQAVAAVRAACAAAGPGEVCYGHPAVTVPDASGLDAPGLLTTTGAVTGLTASPLDPAAGSWGLATITLAETPLHMVLLGEAILTPGQPAAPTVDVVSSGTVNVRAIPSSAAWVTVLGQLTPGQTVTVDGRLANSSWLRLPWEDGHGWVFAELVRPVAYTGHLDVIDPAVEPDVYEPLQAVLLSSNAHANLCPAVAQHGLLVQTTTSAPAVLVINGVTLTLHQATVLVQPLPDAQLRVCVAEGGLELATPSRDGLALAGMCLTAPAEDDIPAETGGAPAALPVEPFVADGLVPLLPLLPRGISPAAPLGASELAQLAVVPRSGGWTAAWGMASLRCANGFGGPVDLSAASGPADLAVAGAGSAVTWRVSARDAAPVVLRRTAPGEFTGTRQRRDGSEETLTLWIVDETHLDGLSVAHFPDDCVADAPFTLEWTD